VVLVDAGDSHLPEDLAAELGGPLTLGRPGHGELIRMRVRPPLRVRDEAAPDVLRAGVRRIAKKASSRLAMALRMPCQRS